MESPNRYSYSPRYYLESMVSLKVPLLCSRFVGVPVCKDFFLVLYGIGKRRLQNLQKHYKEHGILPRTHGNKGRMPIGVCSINTIQNVVSFLDNYGEEHAVALPGRVPGFKRTDIRLLPSSNTKASVHRLYEQSAESAGIPVVSYSKFVEVWNKLRPHIRITKPMTDLCHTCQKNNSNIYRSANLPDEEKSAIVRKQERHLLDAERERSLYKNLCDESKESIAPILPALDFNTVRASCSFKGKMHYSFDYAQQVHLPSYPMQPGPIYIKVPRKVGIFGVCCEALPKQVNFLIDEAGSMGKGANATISYLHYFFENHGIGETDVHLNADNCCGQNKNSYFLWYLAWRVIVGLHQSCIYSFLIVGHTKFACDWCFGLLKQSFRKCFVSLLYELASVVDTLTVSGVNVSQLCSLHDGSVIVPVYDWVSFLSPYFKKFPNIKKYHHYQFKKESPGVVFYKEFSDSTPESFTLLREGGRFPPVTLPTAIAPKGLDHQRKLYLFNDIRQFCKEGTEDLIAPKP